MRDFFVPRDMLLCESQAAMPGDFSVRGFPAGQSEAMGTLTVTVSSADQQPWTVAAMTTLSRWWDADGLAVGGISSWTDKSGLGKHMTQATASSQPYSNGVSVLTDGVDDELSADLTCLVGATYWIFYVVTLTSDGMYMLTSMNNVDRGLCQQYLKSNGVYWSHNSPGTGVSISNVTPVLSIGDPVLTCYDYSGGVMRWWRDGVLRASLSTTKSLTSLASGRLGRRQAAPQYDDIRMHEIIITNTRPDDALRQKIEGYSAHKWDKLLGTTKLVASLPANHPYKSAAPTL